MSSQRVLIVDRDPDVRDRLRAHLSAAGFVVLAASGTATALREIDETPPDVILLDTGLPNADCMDLFQFRGRLGDVPALFLTEVAGDWVSKLRIGGDDYALKPLDPQEVTRAVRSLIDRRRRTLRHGDLTLNLERRLAFKGDEELGLTPTEFRLLHTLLTHRRRVLTKAELLEAVWGYDYGGTSVVLERFVSNLRRKVGGSLIDTVRGVGYQLS